MARSPLFDIYDPYGDLQQQAEYGLLPSEDEEIIGAFPVKRKPQLSDLMPEEEQQGLLQMLASAGASGLSGLGWILDTPGAAIRGTLSGGLGKGLSSFWETSDERVDGRELLRQYGMAGEEDNWSNFGGGLGAEVLLDPMTYLSLGAFPLAKQALTRTGKAARAAGMLDDLDVFARKANQGPRQYMRGQTAESLLGNISDDAARDAARTRFVSKMGEKALAEPLAGMNRLSFPGFQDGATDLFGKSVGDRVAKFQDDLGEGILTNPYIGGAARQVVRAFDPAVMGQTDYARQIEARDLTAARNQRGIADRTKLARLQYDAERELGGLGKSLNDRDVSAAMRTFLEQGEEFVDPEMMDILNRPGVRNFTGFFEGYRDVADIRAQRLGIPLDTLKPREGGNWVSRQQTAFDVLENAQWPKGVGPPDAIRKPYGRTNKPVMLSDSAGRRRDYTSVVGSTDSLNRMSVDSDFQELLRNTAPENTQDEFRKWVSENLSGGEGSDLYPWLDEVDNSAKNKIDQLVAQRDRTISRAGGATRQSQKLDEQIAGLQANLGEPEFLHKVPELPKDHPLVLQHNALQEQIAAAERAGAEKIATALKKKAEGLAAQIPDPRDYQRDQLYQQLGDFVRKLDPQHARKNVPIFGNSTFGEIANYVTRRGRAESLGDGMLDILAKRKEDMAASAVEGGVNYSARDALKQLGYTDDAVAALEKRTGGSIDEMSFNKKFVDDWTTPMLKGRSPVELNPLMEAADEFTKSFKTLALASPSRLTRDAYSGAFAAAMLKSFNPVDWFAGTQMRSGNYKPLTQGMLGGIIGPRLAKGEYAELFKQDPEAALRAFLTDAGGQGLGTSTFSDEAMTGATAGMKEMFPGASKPTWSDFGNRVKNAQLVRGWNPLNSDWSPFAVRGSDGNRNPILEAFDRGAETTDAGNRFGTYLNQIRQGSAPSEASRVANLSQVDYRPEAFTDFERRYLKRIMPFYSYTRGIMPLIGDELANRPAGLMGKSIRAINRASAPGDDSFTPEYLRQSASIPLTEGGLFGLEQGSNLKRFLTNIDLPFESAINLITPGVGNTAFEKVGNTLQKTALNVLGQTNPLIKGPLESVTNRQFYSGRQLSDLYSMLEQTLGTPGRSAEQVLSNLPGGSRLLGTVRQLNDDRLDPREKWTKLAVNTLTGLKFQDVDQERTKRLAARDMLNTLLETTPGVRSYENITVPPEVLAAMPKEQKDMYLLYKIIQSEAAKRARDKKKQEMALDPLEILGVLNNA